MNLGKTNKVLSIYCVEVSQFSSEIQNLLKYQKARINDILYYTLLCGIPVIITAKNFVTHFYR